MKNQLIKEAIENAFAETEIFVSDIQIRRYPDETIVIVYVPESDQREAIELANSLDEKLVGGGFDGFVTIKKSQKEKVSPLAKNENLQDSRVTDFVNLLVARSRTTETQPSLEYIPGAKDNTATMKAFRHHLVFGRRGSGKTALLVETKKQILHEGGTCCWVNLQTFRHEEPYRIILHVASSICEEIQSCFQDRSRTPQVVTIAVKLDEDCKYLLAQEAVNETKIKRLIPTLQKLIRRFLNTTSNTLFLFLDDFHYIERRKQPLVLDLLHGAVRDCDAWLKVATIQHLSKWWNPEEQLGLQSGHDAAIVDLDITLHEPLAAKEFLETMLLSYAQHCGIDSLKRIYSTNPNGLDRILLASGAVPRDYLTLCSTSVQEAKRRVNAKRVGVQAVNTAAGDAKQRKLDELEEDAAKENQIAIKSLRTIRDYCMNEKSWTFFRIDFQEKEELSKEYGMLQVLADLRFVHLIEPSLSDEREAGHRSEVYLLDLSQYAGQRLKRKLNLLDFVDGHLMLKRRVGKVQDIIGNTPHKRTGLLRRAPVFSLLGLTNDQPV